MSCTRFLERHLGDLDQACAYRTTRTLVIRDRKLGCSLLSLQAFIFIYVVVWQILFSQVYMAQSDFAGVVRLQLQAPSAECVRVYILRAPRPGRRATQLTTPPHTHRYRWPGDAAPYCLGTEAVPPAYPLAPDYTGAGAGAFTRAGGFKGTQRHCQFFDEVTAVPIPETDRLFLTTETRITAQGVAPAGGACTALESSGCAFLPAYNKSDDGVTRRSFVANVEFFTLLIDHNMNAPLAGISRTVKQMEGAMQAGVAPYAPVDACDAYRGFPRGCDREMINVGVEGYEDMVSMRTLLKAAGIYSLDDPAGLPGDATTSYREAGLVLNLEISYTNYYLTGRGVEVGTGRFDKNYLKYVYRVSTVPNTEYKFITSAAPYPSANNTVRELVNRHGIRILVTTAGRVGYFDLMTFLINLNVAAGLLGVSYVLMDMVVVGCCAQKELFKQFKERQTVNMTAFRKAVKASAQAEDQYKRLLRDKHLEDAKDVINQRMKQLIDEFVEEGGLAEPFSPAVQLTGGAAGGDGDGDGAEQPLLRGGGAARER